MFFKKKQKEKAEEKEDEDLKDAVERKIIASSYVNPEMTEHFVESVGKQVSDIKIMEFLLMKTNKLEDAKKLTKKLRKFFNGKHSLSSIYALTSVRVEIETSGFLQTKIKTKEEMMGDFQR